MEEIMITLSVSVVGTIVALICLGVKTLMKNKDFKKFAADNELLIELFKTVIVEFVKKYPNLDPRKNEDVLKAYLQKEVKLYFKYDLTNKQLDRLFEAAKDAYKQR